MARNNKSVDWKELFIVTAGDFKIEGFSKQATTPAVKITFSRVGRENRFSHTPGSYNHETGDFRNIQHIHQRSLDAYRLLLNYSNLAVQMAKRPQDFERIIMHPQAAKNALINVVMDLEKESAEKQMLKDVIESAENPPLKRTRSKPSFGASIGEIVKSKE